MQLWLTFSVCRVRHLCVHLLVECSQADVVVLSGDPAKRARAIVQAVTHYNNPAVLAEVSTDLGDAMVGIST